MCGRLPGISADDSRFFLVQEELQRLLVDEAEEAEANCTVDELLSALRKTHRAMTVEESALRAFLDEMNEIDVTTSSATSSAWMSRVTTRTSERAERAKCRVGRLGLFEFN